MSNRNYLFTSEAVSEGHPDKLCDQISDAVLDWALTRDKNAHVACETFATTDFILVGGEVKTPFAKDLHEDLSAIARKVCYEVGYVSAAFGLDYKTLIVEDKIHAQSAEIDNAVISNSGAGDQGIMFGFACDETKDCLPATSVFANKVLQYAARLRKDGTLYFLRPDAKSQVTIEYDGFKPVHIDTIVLSHQHDGATSQDDLKAALIDAVIKPVLGETGLLDDKTKYYINPSGSFVKGGPDGDAGLTGRKIICDTYGGAGRHGGGAFSGKDPSKVDRAGAYMARYIAKNIVVSGVAKRCEVQLSYAIGVAKPISIMVNTFGTATAPEEKIEAAIQKLFDCTPFGIIKTLDLLRPIYRENSIYGHFSHAGAPWEATDKAQDIADFVKG